MTQKNRTLEGKNRTLGGRGGQKSSKIVGHHLCTFPSVNSSFLASFFSVKKLSLLYLEARNTKSTFFLFQSNDEAG